MIADDPHLVLRLAADARDVRAAQRLRYEVFVTELGGDGPLVDHAARLEADAFDSLFDHLLLIDRRRDPAALRDVVGVYRLLPGDRLGPQERFYSETEYDLTALRQSGRRLLELGRSCVHPAYRGGTAMFHLWNGLADYVLAREIEVLFGTASFHGTDAMALAMPLAYEPVRHGYYYTAPVQEFPMMKVSQGEVAALLLAQKSLEEFRGTPFERPLASAFRKLSTSLNSATAKALMGALTWSGI
jgi:putative hemolysin